MGFELYHIRIKKRTITAKLVKGYASVLYHIKIE